MKLGMVGIGKMGANMTTRLIRGGHEMVVCDPNTEAVAALVKEGAVGTSSLEELVQALPTPRVVWLMLPVNVLPTVITKLEKLLSKGDVVIDGGNSKFTDDRERTESFAKLGINFVDVGTSGGIWGLERGYCMMIGGPKDVVQQLDPIFKTLAPGVGEIGRTPGKTGEHSQAESGYLYCGPSGAGHFTKMVHNGIEYGLMQAYAEGLSLLRESGKLTTSGEKFDFPLADIAEVWRRGSVISSWLLDLTAEALLEDASLDDYSAKVDDTGEGRWMVDAAIETATPLPVITASLFSRFQSRVQDHYMERVISAMRNKFGGHQSKK